MESEAAEPATSARPDREGANVEAEVFKALAARLKENPEVGAHLWDAFFRLAARDSRPSRVEELEEKVEELRAVVSMIWSEREMDSGGKRRRAWPRKQSAGVTLPKEEFRGL